MRRPLSALAVAFALLAGCVLAEDIGSTGSPPAPPTDADRLDGASAAETQGQDDAAFAAEGASSDDGASALRDAAADAGPPSSWLAVGGDTTCARREGDGGTYCWGYLWNGTTSAPMPSPNPAPDSYDSPFVEACATYGNQCFRDGVGNVVCHGVDWGSLTGFPLRHMVQLACGHNHACARTDTGGVVCWGDNLGQLGRNDAGDMAGDVLPPAPADALTVAAFDLAAGDEDTCAVMAEGEILCWGMDFKGEVSGTGGPSHRVLSPTRLFGVPPAARVSLGMHHSCALTRVGEVYCWGDGSDGELGGGAGPVPVRVPLPMAAIDLAVGNYHSCVILEDRRLFCWGANESGEVGVDSGASVVTPPQWTGLTGARLVGAGGAHVCALTEGGLYCWGSNASGQLGIGDLTTPRVSAPVPVRW